MKRSLCLLLAFCLLIGILPAAMAEDPLQGHEPVTISFGGWGDYFLLNEQCRKFEEKYPWITVDVVKPIGVDWYAADLTKLAATGDMPDVFNIENLPVALQNEWVLDMTDLFYNDPDHVNYPEWMLEYCTSNDRIYTLISCLYVNFIELNLSLLDEYNIPIPNYNWTIEEWADILRRTTIDGQSIGVGDLITFLQWLPGQMGNPNLDWLFYNSETKQWDFGEEFIEIVNLLKDMYDEGVALWNTLDIELGVPGSGATAEEKTAITTARYEYLMQNYGATNYLWYKGLFGMDTNSSWALNWTTFFAGVYSGFEWDIYPFPVFNEGDTSRVNMLNEFLSISASCQHPEEAYLLLKYMSYDLDGYQAKVDFMANYDKKVYMAQYPNVSATSFATTLYIYLMPPTTDPRALDIFQQINPNMNMEGLKWLFANMNDGGYLNALRIVPGYQEVYDMLYAALRDEIFTGNRTASDMAEELQRQANEVLNRIREQYKLN